MFYRLADATISGRASSLVLGALAGGWLVLLACVTPAVARAPADIFRPFAAGSAAVIDHTGFDTLLQAYVSVPSDGVARVDYRRFKAEGHAGLKAYLASMQKVDVATLDRPEQFAFWSNLYNAKTLDIVLEHYPVASIKDISLGGGLLAAVTGGPWKSKVVMVGGESLSLDDIEHGILRPVFKDPRVHYAVNCASIGCPNIPQRAFTGAMLDNQLDAAARAFVNHSRGARITSDGLAVSSIYSWFQVDFGGNDKGVIDHLRRYAGEPLKAKLGEITDIEDHSYDWSLNDVE